MAGRMHDDRDRWNRYPPSTPLPTEGGIATTKQRGAMAGTWWSRRFVEVLESYGLGGRMSRGRRYARKGQVVSFEVSAGLLTAHVQGSRVTPYAVTIEAPMPTTTQWDKIDHAMRTRVGFAAQLLAGEVPAELEAVFDAAKAQLLPSTWAHLTTACSCPDYENPCKHIAAVLYVFADHLDRDPWLLLEWRGRTRDQILGHLRARAAGAADRDESPPVAPWWPFGPRETLPLGAAEFANAYGEAVIDAADPPDAVLQRCEPLDVTARGMGIHELLGPVYDALAHRAES